jgi:hypothetical protein
MTDDNAGSGRLHQALHQIPGIPDHHRAHELNGNRTGRVRGIKVNEAGRARAQRWSTTANEAGARAAARRNATPPRVLVGVQEFIAHLLRQGG